MRKVPEFILVCLITSSFAGCLGTSDPPREPNIFSLSITIPDAGQDFIIGNDTLTVIGYKMLIDSIIVTKATQEEERFAFQLRLASYTIGFTESYVVGSGQVGGGRFNGVRFSIVRPPQLSSFDDPDLIERDGNGLVIDRYSISLSGVYKGQFFRFRSRVSRTVEYGFSNEVKLGDVNGFLEARLRGNWKQWFINSSGTGTLDPNVPSNSGLIEENILKYFDIVTFSFGEIP